MNDILQHKGYYTEVHFSAKDEVFFGKFANAVADYIATCQEIGKLQTKHIKEVLMFAFPLLCTKK
jgi:predicted HicB family RNase H-like nuclease